MNNYMKLFEKSFPKNHKMEQNNCHAHLYPSLELDYYGNLGGIIVITLDIELNWVRLTKDYKVTSMRLEKLKELHEYLSSPF